MVSMGISQKIALLSKQAGSLNVRVSHFVAPIGLFRDIHVVSLRIYYVYTHNR